MQYAEGRESPLEREAAGKPGRWIQQHEPLPNVGWDQNAEIMGATGECQDYCSDSGIREATIRFVALTTAKRANRTRMDGEG
jgi:hypothetical protein